jgi:hypothetical protein
MVLAGSSLLGSMEVEALSKSIVGILMGRYWFLEVLFTFIPERSTGLTLGGSCLRQRKWGHSMGTSIWEVEGATQG